MSAWDDLLAEQRQAALDDLLSRWHAWQQTSRVARGYADRSATCADYRTPASFNSASDADEAIDESNEEASMRALQGCVDNMPPNLRRACYALARNAALGANVFRSGEAETMVEAREQLLLRLIAAGLVE